MPMEVGHGLFVLSHQVETLAQMAVWIALELASERRPELCASDGKGRYLYQYERAIQYFDLMSKGQLRSIGEGEAGAGANTGGATNPPLDPSDKPRFIFAPDLNSPTGHGGY